MIFSIKLDDSVYSTYAEFDKNSPQRAIERQLVRFKDFPPNERAVILRPEERKELETLHQTTFDSGKELVEWVKKLKALEVGGVTLHLSDGQMKRINDWATFYGKPREEWLKTKLQEALNSAFGGA